VKEKLERYVGKRTSEVKSKKQKPGMKAHPLLRISSSMIVLWNTKLHAEKSSSALSLKPTFYF